MILKDFIDDIYVKIKVHLIEDITFPKKGKTSRETLKWKKYENFRNHFAVANPGKERIGTKKKSENYL